MWDLQKQSKLLLPKPARQCRTWRWFEVVEQRGNIKDNKVAEYQVVLKVGFKIEH